MAEEQKFPRSYLDHNFVADGLIVHNSHTAAYAQIGYQTAYLKTHYPAEFMAVRLGVHGGFYSPRVYMAEARRLGLVHEVCPTGGLEEAANKIVEAVLMNAPLATTATKLRSLASARAFIDEGELRDLIDEHARTRQQAEATEGLASFKEKRKPSWYPG